MEKILLVSYNFPPDWEAQSIRWYYLSRELAKKGYAIDVLTKRSVKKPREKEKFLEKIKILEIFPGPIEFFFSKAREGLWSSQILAPEFRKKRKFHILKKGSHLIKKLFSLLLLGDYKNEWYPFITSFLKKLPVKDYKILITSHEPLVDSLIGLFLKKKYPHLYWIADVADPFDAFYYPFFWKPILRKIEKKVCFFADKLIVTSVCLKETLSKKYNLSEEKIEVIPQGFDEEFFYRNENPSENSVFTLVYTGSFYKGFRDPEEFFKALVELDFDFRLILVGRVEGFIPKDEKLKEKIVYLGVLSHKETLTLQRKADLLVCFSNKDRRQVPGKFFEYLGSKRPILCITYDLEDEIARLTRGLRVGLVVKNGKEAIKEGIKVVYQAWKDKNFQGIYKYETDFEALRKFSWQKNTEKIVKIFKNFKIYS